MKVQFMSRNTQADKNLGICVQINETTHKLCHNSKKKMNMWLFLKYNLQSQ